VRAFRNEHQFIVVVIRSMDDCDTQPLEPIQRFRRAQYVCVQFLSIRSNDARHVPIVHRVDETPLRVPGPEWSVYLDRQ